MADRWRGALPRSTWSGFRAITIPDDWFEAYEVADDVVVFHEPRHYERTLATLLIGRDRAALIDTGCGIGDLRRAVRAVTDRPVVVVNTHTHPDHLGGNHQFGDVAMFDHPSARRVAARGVPHDILKHELLAEHLVFGPWPRNFDPEGFSVPPFEVGRWLRAGDRIDLGERDLVVIHTPGEAPDHISLLDHADRLLFCGDILLHGPVWTHLEGGSVEDLVRSYRTLMGYYGDFDHLMPGHNETMLGKELLPASLAGAEQVASGRADSREVLDPWGRKLREHCFGRFSITTPVPR